MTKSDKAIIVLTLAGASGVALADGGTPLDQIWKAEQLQYVECVASETDKRLGSDQPSMTAADQAINVCDFKLYRLGVDYGRWLKAAGTMVPKEVDTEVLRFSKSTRGSARSSMIGDLIVLRQDADVVMTHRKGLANEPGELLAYEVR